MIYGYFYDKIGSINIDQLDYDIDKEYIYIDSELSRNNFNKLLQTIKPNDVIIISSLCCLGNNYYEILDSLNKLLNDYHVIIKVLDNPTLNESINNQTILNVLINTMQEMVNIEKEHNKQKQLKGIKQAKEKGIKFGRPKTSITCDTNQVLDSFINKKITNEKAAKAIGVSRATFFRMAKARRLELAGEDNE